MTERCTTHPCECENNADARRSALRHCRKGLLAMDSPHIPGHVEQSAPGPPVPKNATPSVLPARKGPLQHTD